MRADDVQATFAHCRAVLSTGCTMLNMVTAPQSPPFFCRSTAIAVTPTCE